MIHFVGAGPGAADLITVRGARLLAAADVVVWTGSLVNPDLLDLCREGARIHDSSGLTLDEIVALLVQADKDGLACVRLHTGDPALFGALAEQTAALDEAGVAFEVVPGVSSLFGASAALGLEYTAPGLTQTLIVTRCQGRTPVPSRERLRDLARHHTTLAIFLSATLVEEVQAELLAAGLDPATPASIVVRATWPDEEVIPCTVSTLAASAGTHDVRRCAIIVVGDVLGPHGGASRLYAASFSHLYRTRRDEGDPCAAS